MQATPVKRVHATVQGKISRTPAQQKLDSHIYLAGQAARGVVNSPAALNALVFDDKGNVHVDIQGVVTPDLLAAITAVGGTVESSYPDYGTIRAWISPVAAETLAARADVTFIKPADFGTTNPRPSGSK